MNEFDSADGVPINLPRGAVSLSLSSLVIALRGGEAGPVAVAGRTAGKKGTNIVSS